jgi:hypothetical protein
VLGCFSKCLEKSASPSARYEWFSFSHYCQHLIFSIFFMIVVNFIIVYYNLIVALFCIFWKLGILSIFSWVGIHTFFSWWNIPSNSSLPPSLKLCFLVSCYLAKRDLYVFWIKYIICKYFLPGSKWIILLFFYTVFFADVFTCF